NFIRVIDAGESRDFAAPGLGVHALAVAAFADLERRVDVHLHEPLRADHVPHLVPRGAVGADGRHHGHAAVGDDFGGDEADATDVRVTVFLAESEALREMRPHHVAVEHGHATAALQH